MVWWALEQTDWMWEDHDKLEVIITPRYLNELTLSSWEPSRKEERGSKVGKEGDLLEMIMYLIFRVDGEMKRGNPWCNENDVGLNSGH